MYHTFVWTEWRGGKPYTSVQALFESQKEADLAIREAYPDAVKGKTINNDTLYRIGEYIVGSVTMEKTAYKQVGI